MRGLLSRLKDKTLENQHTPRAKVVAFINQKGGVGKTTLAFNTAWALAKEDQKVLCLDLDPQANLSLLFNQNNNPNGLYQLLINSVRELRSLHAPLLCQEAIVSKGEVDLIPGQQELSGLELSLASINTTPKQLVLKRFLEKNDLLNQYDYIVIDAPPTLGLIVVNILCACDGVIVPFRPDEFSRKGLEHLHQVLEDVADMGLSQVPEVLAYVPNLVDPRRKQEGDDLVRIVEEFGARAPVLSAVLNRAPLVKSMAQRKTVFDYEAAEYKELHRQFNHLATLVMGKAIEEVQGEQR